MSSGELPFSTYHRAQSLGEGTYGSVVAVYNDAGEEFALKMFDPDEDHGTMELGTMRELSILRILRGTNAHPNVVELADVHTAADEECGGSIGVNDGRLCMAMPVYRCGDLGQAKVLTRLGGEEGGQQQQQRQRRWRAEIAHGLLSAVAFLHDNGVIHRDIKSDNVMIVENDSSNDNAGHNYIPVLIDFSLAKAIEGPSAVLPPSATRGTHTPQIGTPTYTAPEVVARQPYGLKSDCWSVGVLLLEILAGALLQTDRDKAAAKLVEERKAAIGTSPYADLVRGLLEVDEEERWSARKALESPLFRRFGLEVPEVRIVHFGEALPLEGGECGTEDENTPAIASSSKRKNLASAKKKKLTPRERTIKKLCAELQTKNPNTEIAAALYAQQMEQLDDELDDIASGSQTLLDCVVVASRFYEEELLSLEELEEDEGDAFPSFRNFSIEEFRDNEVALFMVMDYCLYIR